MKDSRQGHPVSINTANPLSEPYPTGAYLISDFGPGNFRSALSLHEHPYRASGSHQVGISDWVEMLAPIPHTPKIWFVDLREEPHGYINGEPVSWYSDNDWINVGRPSEWIKADEEYRIAALKGSEQIFTIEDDQVDDLHQERVLPVSKTGVQATSVMTEKQVVEEVLAGVFAPTKFEYVRIPVSDHCAPRSRFLRDLEMISEKARSLDWVHFHCHGGDGRTTTFLALYDMLCWRKEFESDSNEPTAKEPLPGLEIFAERQWELSGYQLNPTGTTGWKLPLAIKRWELLRLFLEDRDRSVYSRRSTGMDFGGRT